MVPIRMLCIDRHLSSVTLPFVRLASLRNVRSFGTETKVDRKALATLRKKTRFSYLNCQKALQTCNGDLDKAEAWLNDQAVTEGWEKVDKLKGRSATQGLVGALIIDNISAIVQVNCETDFVARNELFRNLVKSVATAAVTFRKKVFDQNKEMQVLSGDESAHLREVVPVHKLQGMNADTGNETVQDRLVHVVNKLGEKVTLSPAMTIATSTKNRMFSYGHGGTSGRENNFYYGNYLAVVTIKQHHTLYSPDVLTLGSGLAKHITGMHPERLLPESKDDEKALLAQPFLMDSKYTVGDLCQKNSVEVIDFIRVQSSVDK